MWACSTSMQANIERKKTWQCRYEVRHIMKKRKKMDVKDGMQLTDTAAELGSYEME